MNQPLYVTTKPYTNLRAVNAGVRAAEPVNPLPVARLNHHQLHRLVNLLDLRLLGPLLPEVGVVDRDVRGAVVGREGGLGESGALLLGVRDCCSTTRQDIL